MTRASAGAAGTSAAGGGMSARPRPNRPLPICMVRTSQIGTVLLGLGLALMPLPAALVPAAPAMALFIVFLVLVPMGTALLFPASTSLVSQRSDREEVGLMMGAQQTFRGIMSIVGPVGATLTFDAFGHGVPFLLAAGIVGVAFVLAVREPRQTPVAATA
ncbi:MAG: hypothetical protein DMD41_08735 [Gemmatimonadetes bacterium]|nr:MAG: hypothetical protein DMD41_08735 [Gemmatimonadota bacterium]